MANDTANYSVPTSLASASTFQRRYPQLCGQRPLDVIQETLIEATAYLEDITSRRLVPFNNVVYENMLWGLSPTEYGDAGSNMPVDIFGSLGISYANAVGANDLVRHFFLDQYAPTYSELWTYNIQSMELILTYGNSQPIDFSNGGIIGPEVNSGHCWLRLGTFAPEGSRIRAVYSGGYTVSTPPALSRACMMQAAAWMVTDGTQALRDGTSLAQLDDQINTILQPWMRY